MKVKLFIIGLMVTTGMLIAAQEQVDTENQTRDCQCDCNQSTESVANFPYPQTTLDGENCICCSEHKKEKFAHLSNSNVKCMCYDKLCNFLSKPIPDIWNIANVDIPQLFITPDPAIVVPEGQQISFPPPVPEEDQIPLAGRNVLVIGGSKGVGEAVAQRFSYEGANVIATSRHPDCYNTRRDYLLWKLDVRKEKDVKKVINKAAKYFNGQIDILVIAPAVSTLGALSDYSGDNFLNALDAGLSGYQRVVHYALPYMRHSNTTRVIPIGSIQAYINNPYALSVYAIVKRALQSWNNQHMTDELWKKAQGLEVYGPTFSLAEPFTFPTRHGVFEHYLPSKNSSLTDPIIHGAYYIAEGVYFDILALDNLQTVLAEQIFRIAVAPQPGVRYAIIEETVLAPIYLPLLQEINLLSATDAFNLVQDVGNVANVTSIYDFQTLYQESFCSPP